ncbi:dihydroorotate dehydrogenase [Methyloprofundus sedimenti]|uniref:Dihydroorotate dehydrogenase n=1 Tax=Methyloprofundus sedimenti TaxID=1420851 RepID=A0A1V8M888_9GAMM|nr:dihydroorotate dehydrogenase-like protein [Methyloprofundus sedimenti]OQK17800.1 dihydroorotate dehydrogenase [Methyloprofundus sedimenti]
MMDLSTHYLGLKLINPLVPSASPLSKDLNAARQLEDAGASALVMHSLFEERIESEARRNDRFFHQQAIGHAEADSFHPLHFDYDSYQDRYLEKLHQLKEQLGIPVIASLNGTTPGGWIEYGKSIQQAGADALELNVYNIAADIELNAQAIEDQYLNVLIELRRHVSIPITMKLSSQFSSPLHFIRKLEQAGATGVALFNRFYQPDIDLETLLITPKIHLSTSSETLLRIRWVALLYGRVNLSIAVTGGFHTVEDIIKALLAGADVTHLCSVLLEKGPQHLKQLLEELNTWLEQHEYESIQQLKGSLSQQHAINPADYERANYIEVLDSYTSSSGVLR